MSRLLVTLAAVVMVRIGSSLYGTMNVPFPNSAYNASLFFALLIPNLLSLQSLVLLNIFIYLGRTLRPATPLEKQWSWDWADWLIKKPPAAAIVGPLIFVSPLLFLFGLWGIALFIVMGVVFYLTPRLLAQGVPGQLLFLTLSLGGGYSYTAWLPPHLTVHACNKDKPVVLRSGEAIPCEAFVFLEEAKGMIVSFNQKTRSVLIQDLAPSAVDALGPNGSRVLSGITPVD